MNFQVLQRIGRSWMPSIIRVLISFYEKWTSAIPNHHLVFGIEWTVLKIFIAAARKWAYGRVFQHYLMCLNILFSVPAEFLAKIRTSHPLQPSAISDHFLVLTWLNVSAANQQNKRLPRSSRPFSLAVRSNRKWKIFTGS